METYFRSICLIILVLYCLLHHKVWCCQFVGLVVNCVKNDISNEELSEERSLSQPFGGIGVADIINIQSYGTDNMDVEVERNFTDPDLRISEIKCLEYIWEVIKKGRQSHLSLKPITVEKNLVGGGRPALHGEFSHMAAVGWRSSEHGEQKWVFKCGASLISDKFLVTAAHCSQLPKYDRSVVTHEPEIVKLGHKSIKSEDDLDIASQIIRIEKFIKHPEYESPRHYYDIALIELQEHVNFGPQIRPACLWTSYDTSAFGNVAVSGWGETGPSSGVISDELQMGDMQIIDDEYCDFLLRRSHNRKWDGLSNHQLCAGVLSGRVDTCRGDSGGPLQAKVNISLQWPVYHLIGVTSFGYGCMRTNMPGIYVRIASFVDWIESIVWFSN